MPVGWDLEIYDASKEGSTDLGLNTALTVVIGVTQEVGNALFGEQGARQRSRDNYYRPQGKPIREGKPKPPSPTRLPKPRKKKSFIEKVPSRKALRSTVGFGGKPPRNNRVKGATRGDIRRKGISLLRRGNASLARFIALRYGAKAIAKYQDYAGRLKRSIRLRKQIVEIDTVTYRIKSYIIKTSTDGKTPYSCTCPDFSQFSNDDRDWLGSKAGPFNPCKHMMAVRDKDKDKVGKWVCSGGVCTLNPLSTTGYATKAECEAKYRPPFKGGQCNVPYVFGFLFDGFQSNGTPVGSYATNGIIGGPITKFGQFKTSSYNELGAINIGGTNNSINIDSIANYIVITATELRRQDGLPDNCGNPPSQCDVPDLLGCTDPTATNYSALANVNNGSCTY